MWNGFPWGKCLISALFQPGNFAGIFKYVMIPRGFGNDQVFYKKMKKCERIIR